MKMSELVHARRSVRTFDGTPLREADARLILEFASKVENPYDIPIQWKLLDRKKDGLSSPVITGTDTFIAGKMLRAPHAEEAFGYSFEKLILFSESLGVGTTWIAGTMDRKAFERACSVSDDEIMPCVSPLGYAADKMSLRETMMRRGIRADSRYDFEKLFYEGSFEKPMTPENAGALRLPLEMVRLGPSAANGQPWRVVICGNKAHFYEQRSKGLSKSGWDIQKIDMGIALCHFELGAAECGIHPVFEIEDPGLSAGSGSVYTATFRIPAEDAETDTPDSAAGQFSA